MKEVCGFLTTKLVQSPVDHDKVIVVIGPDIPERSAIDNHNLFKALLERRGVPPVKAPASVDQQALGWVAADHDAFAHGQLLYPPLSAWLVLLEEYCCLLIVGVADEFVLRLVRSLLHDRLVVFL